MPPISNLHIDVNAKAILSIQKRKILRVFFLKQEGNNKALLKRMMMMMKMRKIVMLVMIIMVIMIMIMIKMTIMIMLVMIMIDVHR